MVAHAHSSNNYPLEVWEHWRKPGCARTAATTTPWQSESGEARVAAHTHSSSNSPLEVWEHWREPGRTRTAATSTSWLSESGGERVEPSAHSSNNYPQRSGSIGENPAAHAQQQELVLGASWSVWKLRRRSYSCPAATATPWGTAAGRQPPHSSNNYPQIREKKKKLLNIPVIYIYIYTNTYIYL